MMVLGIYNISKFIDIDGAMKSFEALSLSNFPGQNLSSLSKHYHTQVFQNEGGGIPYLQS